jgi:hypothetical protein
MRTMTAFDLGALASRSVFEKTAMNGPLLGPQAPAKPSANLDMFSQFNKATQDPANAWQPNKFVGPPAELQGSKPNTTIPFRPSGNNPVNKHHRDLRLAEIAQRPDPLRQTPVPPRPVDPAVAKIREYHRQAAIPRSLDTQKPSNAHALEMQRRRAEELERQNDLGNSVDSD